MLLSKILMEAPIAMAAFAAVVPAFPAPTMTISVGEIPATPPNNMPLPPCVLLSKSEAILMAA